MVCVDSLKWEHVIKREYREIADDACLSFSRQNGCAAAGSPVSEGNATVAQDVE